MATVSLPKTQIRKTTERVIDARICVLSGCRFLESSIDRSSGQVIRTCGAGVYKAHLPGQALQDEVRRNPAPIPGYDEEHNPFLLRLLMSADCLRPECGSVQITSTQRVLVVDPEETTSELFSS